MMTDTRGMPLAEDTDNTLKVRLFTNYNTCNFSCEYCIARNSGSGMMAKVAALKSATGRALRIASYLPGMLNRMALHSRPGPRSTGQPRWDDARFLDIADKLKAYPRDISVRIGVLGEFFTSRTLIEGAAALSMSPNCRSVNIITNLSFPVSSYEKFFRGYNLKKVGIVASYHHTQIKDRYLWLSTAQAMDSMVDFAVCVVAWPPIMSHLKAIVHDMRSRGLSVFLQAFQGFHDGRRYPEAYTRGERALLRELFYSSYDYQYMVELKKPRLCNAGFNYIYLDMSGNAFRCGGVADYLGSIHDNSIALYPGPMPCPASDCFCDTDNLNTVEFMKGYLSTGINQHKYRPAVK